ncbi:hypothetical protein BD414DRAFT_472195 [Trametes punicea]|nr:hypothetical protein BD414DRAFT_472195 [Trametes punicea]
MVGRTLEDGYVEDSEDEEIMTLDNSTMAAKAVAGSNSIPPPPPPQRMEDNSASSIQTPNFPDQQSAKSLRPFAQPTNGPNVPPVSSIQSADFTADRSIVSEISSFNPTTRRSASSIQTAQTVSNSIDASISTSTSTSSALRVKPRPRPAYKKQDASAPEDSSIAAGAVAPSNSALDRPLPSPLVSSVGQTGAPSYGATTSSATTAASTKSTSGKERISDSGVEMASKDRLYSQDIAERAKLRSRARTQASGKGKAQEAEWNDIIELSSDDDELSFLPKAKSKTKPKPKQNSKDASVGPSSEKDARGVAASKNSSDPPPRKRTKTNVPIPDAGSESDINTIPVPTSDFPVPGHHAAIHSSQLPPSDPPPSTTTSASAHTNPHASQEIIVPNHAGPEPDASPLSSPPPPMPRKRKRPPLPSVAAVETEDDRIDTGRSSNTSKKQPSRTQDAKDLCAEAPPFSPDVVPETQPPAKPSSTARRKRQVPADDDDDDEDWNGNQPAKPSRSRKKARITDDDDFGGGEDDDDDDWGESTVKRKAKGRKTTTKTAPKKKGKAKAKAKVNDALGPAGAHDEDSISALPILPAAPTSKRRRGRIEDEGPSHESKAQPTVVLTRRVTSGSSPEKGLVKNKTQGKRRTVVLSDKEDAEEANAADVSTNSITLDNDSPAPPPAKKARRASSGEDQTSDVETKENDAPVLPTSSSSVAAKPITISSSSATAAGRRNFSHANRSYTIAAKSTKNTPMSELIRRASAQPGSPFPASSRPTYSPLIKASKSALRRIAPLHPHRRTPPPPPPRPPPPKKSKKMLELEEKWEMELEESVEGWYAMSEEDRAALRRAKRDAELGFFED